MSVPLSSRNFKEPEVMVIVFEVVIVFLVSDGLGKEQCH